MAIGCSTLPLTSKWPARLQNRPVVASPPRIPPAPVTNRKFPMPYLIDCSEWQLIQSIGLGISQRKSRFDGSAASHRSSTSLRAHPDAELLDVELRRVFLQKDCRQNLSAFQFEEFEAALKRLCDLLDRLVHPQLRQTSDGLQYRHLRAVAKHLDTSDQSFDLACGPHSTLFKLPENGTELKLSLEAVAEYNDSLARLFTTPQGAAPPRLRKEDGERMWKDAGLRGRASVVLRSLFEHFKCGTSHEVMLKLSHDIECGTAPSSVDVMLPLCPDPNQWHEVECCANHSYAHSIFYFAKRSCLAIALLKTLTDF